MSLIIDNHFVYFTASDAVGKKLDATYVKSRGMYKVPNTIGALRELEQQGFENEGYLAHKEKIRQHLLELKNTEDETLYLCEQLRPYQRQDISYLHKLPHSGVFNAPRTGKSPMTLKLIELEQHEKIIVICPASLVLNWKKEVETWTDYEVSYVNGTKTKRSKTYQEWESKKGFLILSKDTAKVDYDLINAKDCVLIVDEAHFLRNHKTAQSKAIFQLGKKAKKRLALTGTPAMNKPQDIFGILHFLYPEKFASYWQFIDRYFKVWESPWGSKEIGKLKREEELQEILDLISVQRKRSDIMQWIPPKTYQTIEVEMDAKQKKVYNDMVETFTIEQDNEIIADAPTVLAQLTRLRQICLHPGLLNSKAPSAKESFVMEWLEDNPNEQVIIFSTFSSYLKQLAEKVKGSLIIGETPKERRQFIVNEFQAGRTKIILANIQAAGVGLTLDKASTVIFLDRDYTPSLNEQAEDRAIATTENSNLDCTIIDVICKDSIDEVIHKILKKKESVIEVVNNYKSIKELVR